MLLVIVFFFSSLTGYALHESGITTLIRETVQIKEHAVTLPEEVIPLTDRPGGARAQAANWSCATATVTPCASSARALFLPPPRKRPQHWPG